MKPSSPEDNEPDNIHSDRSNTSTLARFIFFFIYIAFMAHQDYFTDFEPSQTY